MQKKKRFRISNKIKISNTLRMALIIIATIIIFFGFAKLVGVLSGNSVTFIDRKIIYDYSNKFNSSTNINLKNNQYMSSDEITNGQTYLSDLISDINMNVNYKYDASKQSNITYSYKIETIMKATYTSSKGTYDVLNKTKTLKEVKDQTVTSNSFDINENLNINYQKYHETIKDFKQNLGISADSNLLIRFTVDTSTTIDSREVKNQYVNDYKISLGDKVAVIEEKNKDENKKVVENKVQRNQERQANPLSVAVSVIIILAGFVLLRFILKNTEELKIIKNEFKIELNKILKSYEDKIVEIQDLSHIDIVNATKVKDIMQLRKLADEALVPIYCYIKEDNDRQKAYFIVTKYENSYIYILK